jgi:hypothetical protein
LATTVRLFGQRRTSALVIIGGSESPSPTQKSTSDKPSPTTSPNGISTPSPIQAGMTTNCDEFYLVTDNDGCYGIEKKYSIALQDFCTWNPAVGDTCMKLFPANHVCVSTIGVGPTTLITVTTSTSTKPYKFLLHALSTCLKANTYVLLVQLRLRLQAWKWHRDPNAYLEWYDHQIARNCIW